MKIYKKKNDILPTAILNNIELQIYVVRVKKKTFPRFRSKNIAAVLCMGDSSMEKSKQVGLLMEKYEFVI